MGIWIEPATARYGPTRAPPFYLYARFRVRRSSDSNAAGSDGVRIQAEQFLYEILDGLYPYKQEIKIDQYERDTRAGTDVRVGVAVCG
jgi:hypothetical protein